MSFKEGNSANKILLGFALVGEGRRSRGKHGRASHKVLVVLQINILKVRIVI